MTQFTNIAPEQEKTLKNQAMLKILIADDHAVVREGLKRILQEMPEVSEVGEAVDGEDTLSKVRNADWDVLVLDMSMPGRSGLDVLKDVKRERPEIKLLVLSMHPEDQFAVRVLRVGAAGYLTKESAVEELQNAIRKVMSGGKYISSSLAEKLAFAIDSASEKPLHANLSDREFQVLRMIAAGKTVKEIGQELALSVKTVSTYRARILEKLSLRTNAELIHYALQHQLVE